MADYPAMPLWTDAYLADTRHLTTVEHGAYMLLLIEAWRRPHCCLPDDDVLLARLTGLSEPEWLEIKPTVMAFWKRDGRSRTWVQKRQNKERTYLATKRQSARDAALTRWNNEKKEDAFAMRSQCVRNAPTPTPIPIKKKDTSYPKKKASRLPETWTLPKAWGEWAVSEYSVTPEWVREQAASFRDYWISLSGPKAAKLDWQATWRNWIRRADKRPVRKSGPQEGERRVIDGREKVFDGSKWVEFYQ